MARLKIMKEKLLLKNEKIEEIKNILKKRFNKIYKN